MPTHQVIRLLKLLTLLAAPSYGWASDAFSLEQALESALSAHPEIQATREEAGAERSLIRSMYWPERPRVGLMREQNMTVMEQQMGPMTSWSVMQEFKFPAKYFLMGSAQRSKAEAADQAVEAKRLEIRRRVVGAYFKVHSIRSTLSFMSAQGAVLSQVVQIASSRYAAGKVPLQDNLKAQIEQTQLESDLIMTRSQLAAATAELRGLVNPSGIASVSDEIEVPAGELHAPRLNLPKESLLAIASQHSKTIQMKKLLASGSLTQRRLARLNYFPDFALSYRRAFINSPDNAYAVTAEVTLPLWFFAKESSESDAAAASAQAAEKQVASAILETQVTVESLISEVQAHERLLQIYRTKLIPQATGALGASQASYRAGRTGFQDLLDTVRSLYGVQITYFKTLRDFSEAVARLEELVGVSLSTLPWPGEKQT